MKNCFYISEIGSSGLTKQLSMFKQDVTYMEGRIAISETMNERYYLAQNGVSQFIRRGYSKEKVNKQRASLENQRVFLLHCEKLEGINRDLTKEEYKDFCDAVDIYIRRNIPNFEIISITT